MSAVIVEAVNSPTIYRWPGSTAFLRIYCNSAFFNSTGAFIGQGNAASVNSYYLQVLCTVVGNVLYIPSFQIDSTTDSPTNPAATYTAVLFTSNGARVGNFLANFGVPQIPANQTWMSLTLYKNQRPSKPILQGVWDTGQVLDMINIALAELRFSSETQVGETALSADPTDPAFPIAVSITDPTWTSIISGGGLGVKGRATLIGGASTVAESAVESDSLIFLTGQDPQVTGVCRIDAITPNASFIIQSSNFADDGDVAWLLLQPSA